MISDENARLVSKLSQYPVTGLIVVVAACLLVFNGVTGLQGYIIVRGSLGVLASLLAPGYLLLRIGGVSPRHPTQVFLYSVGLSAAFLLALGTGAFVVFSALGFERPLTVMPWVLTLALVGLSALTYYRTSEDPLLRRFDSPSPRVILAGVFLILLPLVTVASSEAVNVRNTSLPTLIQISLFAGVVLLLVSGVIPAQLRPLAVWSVALSVLLQMTLVTSHLWGWDIHFEYYTAQVAFYDGVWNPAAEGTTNSLLSVTFLAAVYASVTDLSPIWVYKLVYPVIGSLLPVAIYSLARTQFEDEWVPTLAPFALIFYYGFFKIMPDKQLVAQVFLVLGLVVMFDDSLRGVRKWLLAITFGTLLIFSHYGISLIFIASLAATKLIVTVLRHVDIGEPSVSTRPLSGFVVLLGVEWVIWYQFSAAGQNFYRVLGILQNVVQFQVSSGRSGIGYATEAFGSPLWAVYRFLMIVLIALFCLGVAATALRILWGKTSAVPDVEYVALSGVFVLFCATSAVKTYLMGFDRILLLTLAVVAPFAAVSVRMVPTSIATALEWPKAAPSSRTAATGFAVYLVVFFLFSSGAAFAAAGEEVPSYSINLDEDAGWPVYQNDQVGATRWLESKASPDVPIAVYNQWDRLKSRDGLLLREVIPRDRVAFVWPEKESLNETQYIYFSDEPMVREAGDRTYIDPTQTRFHRTSVVRSNKVYSSGDARVFLSSGSAEQRDQSLDAGTNATQEN